MELWSAQGIKAKALERWSVGALKALKVKAPSVERSSVGALKALKVKAPSLERSSVGALKAPPHAAFAPAPSPRVTQSCPRVTPK